MTDLLVDPVLLEQIGHYQPDEDAPCFLLLGRLLHTEHFLLEWLKQQLSLDASIEWHELEHAQLKRLGFDQKPVGIDDIRQLKSWLPLKSASRRFLIINASHLSPTVSNACLKMTEEPHTGLTIVLTAQSHTQVLPTLQSRCVNLNLALPSTDKSLSWLEQQGIEATSAAQSLKAYQGCPFTALHFEQASKQALKTKVFQGFFDWLDKNTVELWPGDDCIKNEQEDTLYLMQSLLHDLSRVCLGVNDGYIKHTAYMDKLTALADRLSYKQVLAWQQSAQALKEALYQGQNQPKYAWAQFALSLQQSMDEECYGQSTRN